MKIIFACIMSVLLIPHQGWLTDFEKAKTEASEKHKYILLNFSGSDWCIPCINFKKTIFEKDSFKQFADSILVLLNADFPRNNQQDKQQVEHNESLAEKYNPGGKFPFTVLLDTKGNILKTWDGLPATGADGFIAQIKTITNAGK
ncbi:MAG: thioredoxin family protein [Ferruginibacter sp.]